VTEVITTCLKPRSSAASAILPGSSSSIACALPFLTEQKLQPLVQTCPKIRNVAVFKEKQSNMLGHLASWQTVLTANSFNMLLVVFTHELL
jgi:ADP-heptose:LPS heptosyltransferase